MCAPPPCILRVCALEISMTEILTRNVAIDECPIPPDNQPIICEDRLERKHGPRGSVSRSRIRGSYSTWICTYCCPFAIFDCVAFLLWPSLDVSTRFSVVIVCLVFVSALGDLAPIGSRLTRIFQLLLWVEGRV